MLVASTSLVSFNCTTPAASFLRMPPLPPRASRHSHALASGPHVARRLLSTTTANLPAPHETS